MQRYFYKTFIEYENVSLRSTCRMNEALVSCILTRYQFLIMSEFLTPHFDESLYCYKFYSVCPIVMAIQCCRKINKSRGCILATTTRRSKRMIMSYNCISSSFLSYLLQWCSRGKERKQERSKDTDPYEQQTNCNPPFAWNFQLSIWHSHNKESSSYYFQGD